MKSGCHILFVGALPPPVHGSALVCQQIKDSKLINDSFECDWVNLSTSRRLAEIGKATIAKPFRLVGALLKELWLLMTRHYDICYLAITCHGPGFLKDAPFVLLCKLFRKRIVIHQHNKGMAADVERWPYNWLLPLCYKDAKVILLSWYLYPDIEKVVPKENVFICPNGIKVSDSDNKSRVKNDTNSPPRLLFLSNLLESKGVLVLLDSLKILKDKGYSFICDFVGGETQDIDASRFNEEVENRGLTDSAFYLGIKYGKDKDDAFQLTDVFVLPTGNDCFPLVLLEAMFNRLPIVSTPIGGIPDIVLDGENGLLSKERDSYSLSHALEKLISSPELRIEMGDAGRKRLELLFTEDVFEKRLKEILWTSVNS